METNNTIELQSENVEQIAEMLGGKVVQKVDKSCYNYVISLNKSFSITMRVVEGSWRVYFRTNEYVDNLGKKHDFSIYKPVRNIRCSASKTPKVLTNEIKRRLLNDIEKCQKEYDDKVLRINEASNRLQLILKNLKDCGIIINKSTFSEGYMVTGARGRVIIDNSGQLSISGLYESNPEKIVEIVKVLSN